MLSCKWSTPREFPFSLPWLISKPHLFVIPVRLLSVGFLFGYLNAFDKNSQTLDSSVYCQSRLTGLPCFFHLKKKRYDVFVCVRVRASICKYAVRVILPREVSGDDFCCCLILVRKLFWLFLIFNKFNFIIYFVARSIIRKGLLATFCQPYLVMTNVVWDYPQTQWLARCTPHTRK